jgi:hypothetical protein
MGLGILTLKKAAGYALFRTLMGISGKNLAEIFKSITLHKVRTAEGLSFLRKGGVTYVTGNGVVERGPGDGSWVCESDLLL